MTKETKKARIKPKMTARQERERERKRGEVPTDLAAKKRHVRELAMAARWDEIRRLYSEKMVTKAKAYVEKSTTPQRKKPTKAAEKITPQLLAQQILTANGYDSVRGDNNNSAAREKVKTPSPESKKQRSDPAHRSPVARVVPPSTAPAVVPTSPDILTEEQKRLIEEKRRRALEKRMHQIAQRNQSQTGPRSSSSTRRQVLQSHAPPDQSSHRRPLLNHRKSACLDELARKEIMLAEQITDWEMEEKSAQRPQPPPRVVTPPTLSRSTMTSAKPNDNQRGRGRAPDLNDEIKAAEDIFRWELDQEMRQSKTQRPVHPRYRDNCAFTFEKSRQSNSQPCKATNETELVHEMAAAAEIIQWEIERDSNTSATIPHRLQANAQISEISYNNKKPSSASSSYDHQCELTNARPKALVHVEPADVNIPKDITGSSINTPRIDKIEEFITKNFLDEKLDRSVLDFVTMILS